MDIPLDFMRELLRQPTWIPVWVAWLASVNLASAAFWHRPEARWILGTFAASAGLMMALFARFGFERILGLGHVLWIPLLVYLAWRLPGVREPRYRRYVLVLMASNAISLVFDIRDVWLHATR